MPAYNFKQQFAEKVRTGAKKQTIRKSRKRPTAVGETLYLYTGQRTKSAKLLKTAICCEVYDIEITPNQYTLDKNSEFPMLIDDQSTLDLFAVCDGFKDWRELVSFLVENYNLDHKSPFQGALIRWDS